MGGVSYPTQVQRIYPYAKGERVNDAEEKGRGFCYFMEVYVNDFMSFVMQMLEEQLQHVANAVMTGIHDVFPTDEDESNDLISLKNLRTERDNSAHGSASCGSILMGF